MSRFGKMIKGTADVRPVEFSLPWGDTVTVGVRPLAAWDETGILEQARTFAKARGVDQPRDDDPLYVMGVWVHTLLVAVVNHDGDDKGAPFFESVEEILKHLDRDRISYLYEQQQLVQEDHGFRRERVTPAETLAFVHELIQKEVDDPTLFFWKLGPTARVTFTRHLAVLLWNSPTPKSHYGSTSDIEGMNGSSPPTHDA